MMNPLFKPPDPVVESAGEPDQVFAWRYGNLRAAGFDEEQALTIANDRRIDLHEALEMAALAGVGLTMEILT